MRLLRALTAPWRAALLLAVTLIGLGYTPATVSNSAASMLSSCGRVVWRGITIAPTPSSPLKAAILNVTTDFDELAHLVGDFLRRPETPPEMESQFKAFLSLRAQRSYPHLESTLDWLLALYKFVFPFLIISMVARLSGGSATGEGTPHPQHQQQPHGQQQHEGEQGGGHGAWEEEEAQGAGQQVVQHRGGGGEDGSGRLRLAPRARSPRAPPLRLAPAPEAHADPRPAGGGGGGAGSTQLVRRESLSPVAAPGTPGAAGLLAAHPAFSGGLYSSSGGGGGGGGKEGAGGKQRGRQQQRVSDIHAYAR